MCRLSVSLFPNLMEMHPDSTLIPVWAFVYAKGCLYIKTWPQYPTYLTACIQYTKQAAANSSYAQAHAHDTCHSYTLCILSCLSTSYCQTRARRKRKCNWHHSKVFFLFAWNATELLQLVPWKGTLSLFKVIQSSTNTTLLAWQTHHISYKTIFHIAWV